MSTQTKPVTELTEVMRSYVTTRDMITQFVVDPTGEDRVFAMSEDERRHLESRANAAAAIVAMLDHLVYSGLDRTYGPALVAAELLAAIEYHESWSLDD